MMGSLRRAVGIACVAAPLAMFAACSSDDDGATTGGPDGTTSGDGANAIDASNGDGALDSAFRDGQGDTGLDPDADADADASSDAGVDAASACPGVDLMNDPLNCGACAHDCLGATCAAGLCAPTLLWSTIEAQPAGLAVDATNIYFGQAGPTLNTGGKIRVCPKSGCGGAPADLTSNEILPTVAAVDATRVYWWNRANKPTIPGDGVSSCELASCAATLVHHVTNEAHIDRMLVRDGYFFWNTLNALSLGLDDELSLVRCAVADCASTKVVLPRGGAVTPGGLSANATSIFWGSLVAPGGTGKVYTCDVTKPAAAGGCGATPPAIGPTAGGIGGSTADATNIYWLDGNDVKACPIGGCVVPTKVTTFASLGFASIEASGNFVYIRQQSGGIHRCAVSGCGSTPTALVSAAMDYIGNIVVDDQWVYFDHTDPIGGAPYQLWRVAK